MAHHVSSFYFEISGDYENDRLKEIVDNAFSQSSYGVKEYTQYEGEFCYSRFRFEESPAEYDEYRFIAEEMRDALIESFKNSEFSIHARWACLAAEGFTDYECEYKNGKLTEANVDAPADYIRITCPDCGEELDPEVDTGSLYGIEAFRTHTIYGESEWKCSECGKKYSFDDVFDLIQNATLDNTYSFWVEDKG